MYIHITKRNMGSRIDLLSLLIVLSYINTTAHTCNNSRTCYNILLLLIFDRTGNGRRYTYVYTCGRHFSVFWDYSLAVGRRSFRPQHSSVTLSLFTHTRRRKTTHRPLFLCVLFLFISERRRRRRRRKVQKQKKKEQVLCIHIVTCCWCSWLFLVLLLSSPCSVCVYRRCVVHCNFERRKRTRRYTHTHTHLCHLEPIFLDKIFFFFFCFFFSCCCVRDRERRWKEEKYKRPSQVSKLYNCHSCFCLFFLFFCFFLLLSGFCLSSGKHTHNDNDTKNENERTKITAMLFGPAGNRNVQPSAQWCTQLKFHFSISFSCSYNF